MHEGPATSGGENQVEVPYCPRSRRSVVRGITYWSMQMWKLLGIAIVPPSGIGGGLRPFADYAMRHSADVRITLATEGIGLPFVCIASVWIGAPDGKEPTS